VATALCLAHLTLVALCCCLIVPVAVAIHSSSSFRAATTDVHILEWLKTCCSYFSGAGRRAVGSGGDEKLEHGFEISAT